MSASKRCLLNRPKAQTTTAHMIYIGAYQKLFLQLPVLVQRSLLHLLEEQLGDFGMALEGCIVQSCPAVLVLCIHVNTIYGEEQLDNFGVALAGCNG